MKLQMHTIAPLVTGLELRPGLDTRSAECADALKRLPDLMERQWGMAAPKPPDPEPQRDYDQIELDNFDSRIWVWEPKSKNRDLQFSCHFYTYGVCVVLARFDLDGEPGLWIQREACEKTRRAIDAYADELNQFLRKLSQALQDHINTNTSLRRISGDSAAWVARAVVLNPDDLHKPAVEAFAHEWLKETVDSEDAKKILCDQDPCDRSVSWVNYLFVDRNGLCPNFIRIEETLDVVRTAQSYYLAHQSINEQMQEVIARTIHSGSVTSAQLKLRNARDRMQFLRVQFAKDCSLMRRSRRRSLEKLLEAWEFDAVVTIGESLLQFSTKKIDELTADRAEHSSIVTDLILAFITILAGFQLVLELVSYSREVMANPSLSYTDQEMSWILQFFAQVDVDTSLMVGGSILVGLLGVYTGWKIRNVFWKIRTLFTSLSGFLRGPS